jgi:hypothetical protein
MAQTLPLGVQFAMELCAVERGVVHPEGLIGLVVAGELRRVGGEFDDPVVVPHVGLEAGRKATKEGILGSGVRSFHPAAPQLRPLRIMDHAPSQRPGNHLVPPARPERRKLPFNSVPNEVVERLGPRIRLRR